MSVHPRSSASSSRIFGRFASAPKAAPPTAAHNAAETNPKRNFDIITSRVNGPPGFYPLPPNPKPLKAASPPPPAKPPAAPPPQPGPTPPAHRPPPTNPHAHPQTTRTSPSPH